MIFQYDLVGADNEFTRDETRKALLSGGFHHRLKAHRTVLANFWYGGMVGAVGSLWNQSNIFRRKGVAKERKDTNVMFRYLRDGYIARTGVLWMYIFSLFLTCSCCGSILST